MNEEKNIETARLHAKRMREARHWGCLLHGEGHRGQDSEFVYVQHTFFSAFSHLRMAPSLRRSLDRQSTGHLKWRPASYPELVGVVGVVDHFGRCFVVRIS